PPAQGSAPSDHGATPAPRQAALGRDRVRCGATMAAKPAQPDRPRPPAKPRARKRKPAAEPASRGLSPDEIADGSAPTEVRALTDAIEAAGGRSLAAYRDPLGGSWLVLAALP